MRTRLNKVVWVIRRYRRISQMAVLLLLILAPFLHIFRFDIPTTSLYLFGMRLWVKHFFFFSLLVTAVIYVVIAASVVFGRVFCGWVCPQNLFNELGRQWDARLGRTGTTILSAAIGLFGGFVVWSYGTDGIALLRRYAAGEIPLAPTVTILAVGAFFTAGMAWWRTDVCRVVCPYGHMQSILANANTMHLELINLPQYRDICAACGLCYEACHMAVDPRLPEQKHCVTCGDCLDACKLVSDARRAPRVLNFVTGAGKGFLPRLAIPAVLVVLLTGITAWGLATRDLVSVVVAKDHRAVLTAGGTQSGGSVMRVSLMNLSGATDTFTLAATGLPDGWAHFEQDQVTLAPGAQADIALRVIPTEYRKGIYKFNVLVTGLTSHATETFQTVHVVGN
ncbi:MAG TPA: 4Fe-4S dicluster domain-containing protein [Symbiobacteriaceae bacterium]|nr:4Fe-4S dicluster domain-containing protein [Symbiobacteriaceae bacterium]